MDLETFNKNIKTIYWEVMQCSSPIQYNKKTYYAKHISPKDAKDIEEKENSYYKKAMTHGLPTNKERIDRLITEKCFDEKSEKKIETNKLTLINLRRTKTKLTLSRDIAAVERQIKDIIEETEVIESKKSELLNDTCETYTAKRMTEFYVYYSIYKDKECEELAFTPEEFEELEQIEIYNLINCYFGFSTKFNHVNLKRLAVSACFLNYFHLCDDNAFNFYGKRICDLSFYQVEVFSYARYFKHIMEKSTIKHPDELNDDIDKMIEWYDSSSNVEKMNEGLNNSSGKEVSMEAVSIMGASKEDMDKIKKDDSGGVSLDEAAKKKGGTLSFQDLIKLHGV